MNKKSQRLFLCIIIFSGISQISAGQIMLSGMVADSTSMQSLPNVNIFAKKSGRGTTTDYRGSFVLEASEGDSIIFSRVGYYSKVLPVRRVKEVVIIFLKEESKMLKPIEIADTVALSWLPRLPPESAWKNSTFNKGFTETPGFQGIQTFGPGYVLRGPFSRFSKDEKEKKKLKKMQEENYRSRNYVSLVNDPEVKGKIMKDYLLTEDQFYRLLAQFNEKNKDVIYRLEGEEVIALLILFYAENAGRK
jgi:hypothetical protein